MSVDTQHAPAALRVVSAVETALALVLTAFAVALHVTFFSNAGALWRDEISSVNLASLGSTVDVIRQNHLDSFPIVWPLGLKTWIAMGMGTSDAALRGLGLALGLSIVAALWWCARELRFRRPLIALAFFALAPTVLVYGDSLRGYGLGTLLLLLVLASMHRLIVEPTTRRIVGTSVLALFAVQSMYPNAAMLLAISIGAWVACSGPERRRVRVTTACIAMVSLASLLPYLSTVAKHREWTEMVRSEVTLGRIASAFSDAVSASRPWLAWIVIALLLIALWVTFARVRDHARTDGPRTLVYLGIAAACALIGHSTYLIVIGVVTPWYFIAPLAITSVCIDAALHELVRERVILRWVRIGIITGAAAYIGPESWRAAHTRMTNVDEISVVLEERAAADDLIVLASWYSGVTLDRYYQGKAPWVSIPDFDERRFQPYAAFKRRMAERDPLKPVLDRITETLRRGHSVWIVGALPLVKPEEAPGELSPAPHPIVGWSELAYTTVWLRQVSHLVLSKSKEMQQITLPTHAEISKLESLPLVRMRGWK